MTGEARSAMYFAALAKDHLCMSTIMRHQLHSMHQDNPDPTHLGACRIDEHLLECGTMVIHAVSWGRCAAVACRRTKVDGSEHLRQAAEFFHPFPRNSTSEAQHSFELRARLSVHNYSRARCVLESDRDVRPNSVVFSPSALSKSIMSSRRREISDSILIPT